jgi:hypothetical protein
MKLAVLSLLVFFGCATAMQPTATGARADCSGEMESRTLSRGTQVRDSPDQTAQLVSTLAADTPACASIASVGFGFRRVKLPDGSSGYVSESSLNLSVR